MDQADLIAKLLRIEALHAGATTPGEKVAAGNARDRILEDRWNLDDRWPDEPSARYALVLGLAMRAESPRRAVAGFRWLADRAAPEWVQLFADDVASRMRTKGQLGVLATITRDEPRFQEFVAAYAALTGYGPKDSDE